MGDMVSSTSLLVYAKTLIYNFILDRDKGEFPITLTCYNSYNIDLRQLNEPFVNHRSPVSHHPDISESLYSSHQGSGAFFSLRAAL